MTPTMTVSSSDRLEGIAWSWRTVHLCTGQPIMGAIMDHRTAIYPGGWGVMERLTDGGGKVILPEHPFSNIEGAVESFRYMLESGAEIASLRLE